MTHGMVVIIHLIPMATVTTTDTTMVTGPVTIMATTMGITDIQILTTTRATPTTVITDHEVQRAVTVRVLPVVRIAKLQEHSVINTRSHNKKEEFHPCLQKGSVLVIHKGSADLLPVNQTSINRKKILL